MFSWLMPTFVHISCWDDKGKVGQSALSVWMFSSRDLDWVDEESFMTDAWILLKIDVWVDLNEEVRFERSI